MMTSAPSLVSVPEKDLETSTDTTLRLPPGDIPTSWDLDKFTFGYGKITLNEIIAWEYDSITKEDATSTSISFGDDVMGRYTLAKTTNDSGKPVIRATFPNGTIGADGP